MPRHRNRSRIQRRGGRKRIVAPDGSAIVPTSKPQPDGTLVKALARAWRWQRGLTSGEYGTLADLADSERISRSYVCRVLRLTLLAPDIVERILDGRPTAGLAHFLRPFPVEWRGSASSFYATARDDCSLPPRSVHMPCRPHRMTRRQQ
jgi:hypothetical protein